MPPLYAELLDGVVGHIDQRRDLWACASVSHDFYRAASRHIYRHLDITLGILAHNSGEKHCEMLNGLFGVKPFVLNSVRSLRLVVPPSATGLAALHTPDKFRHSTEFLLRLTHAKSLEEMKIEKQASPMDHRVLQQDEDSALVNQLGLHFSLALEAIRCVPSLRRVELVRLGGAPTVLFTGIPGKDVVVHLSVDSVTFEGKTSEPTSWTLSDISRDSQLAVHFERARADWPNILLAHTQLDAFNRGGDPPLRTLQHLCLSSLSTFQDFLHDVRSVKTVHYIGREGPRLPLNGYGDANLVREGIILGQRCPQLHKLILDMDSHLGFKGGRHWIPDDAPPSIFQLKSLIGLREIQFDVQKPVRGRFNREFGAWCRTFIAWIKTAVVTLQTLEGNQQLDKVTITLHDCEVGIHRGWFVELYTFLDDWQELQSLLDSVPALSSAKMVLDVTILWDDNISGVTLEEYVRRMGDVWHHPRCFVNCSQSL